MPRSKFHEVFIAPREQRSDFGFAVWDAYARMMPECHHHDDIEVNFQVSGGITYLHGGRLIQLKKGDVAVFWAGRPHQVVAVEGEPRHRGLSVPLGWFLNWNLPNHLVKPLLEGRMVFPPNREGISMFPDLTDRLVEDLLEDTSEHRKTMLLEIEAWFRRVALSVAAGEGLLGKSADKAEGGDLGKVEQMARYIHAHYMDPLTTAEVARAVNLHPNYAVSLFRKKTGSTLIDFITKQRLARVQLDLATTDKQVLEAALDAGFGSASRFYAVYRKSFNMSPSAYRAMIRTLRWPD